MKVAGHINIIENSQCIKKNRFGHLELFSQPVLTSKWHENNTTKYQCLSLFHFMQKKLVLFTSVKRHRIWQQIFQWSFGIACPATSTKCTHILWEH